MTLSLCILFHLINFHQEARARAPVNILDTYKKDSQLAIEHFFAVADSDSMLTLQYGLPLFEALMSDEQDSLAVVIGYELGEAVMNWGNLEEAEIQFRKLANYSYKRDLIEGKSYASKGLGDVAEAASDFEQALAHFHEAEKGWIETSNYQRLGYLYNNMGVCYRKLGNNYRALQQYVAAVDMLKKVDDPRALAYISNNIGNIYLEQRQLDKALAYYELARENGKAIADARMLAYVYNNIGLIYDSRDERDAAYSFFEKGLRESRKSTDHEAELLSLTNLGEANIDRGSYDSAILLLNDVLQKSETYEDLESKTYAHIGLGKAYLAQGKSEQARQALMQGLQLAKETHQAANMRDATRYLAQSEERLGNLKDALVLERAYQKIADSLKQIESSNNLALLQAEYEFKAEQEKKDAQIQALKSDNQIQELRLSERNLWIWILALVAISALVIGFLVYNQRLVRKQKEANDLKQKLLRVQLNPHFMFNSLNAIQNLVYRNADRQKTADYLARFSHLTRQILELNQHDFISLEDEIRFIENYLMIQQIRFDEPFHYYVEVDEMIDTDSILIPPMITQPFLENAIEHGIINKNGKGEIRLHFTTSKEQLQISIEDNGVGRDAASFEKRTRKHRSLATQITKDRLENLQKSFRKQAQMLVEDIREADLIKGTRVAFILPLKYIE